MWYRQCLNGRRNDTRLSKRYDAIRCSLAARFVLFSSVKRGTGNRVKLRGFGDADGLRCQRLVFNPFRPSRLFLVNAISCTPLI
jgi:hypothetical protein